MAVKRTRGSIFYNPAAQIKDFVIMGHKVGERFKCLLNVPE